MGLMMADGGRIVRRGLICRWRLLRRRHVAVVVLVKRTLEVVLYPMSASTCSERWAAEGRAPVQVSLGG
jgi:hypothetical protein